MNLGRRSARTEAARPRRSGLIDSWRALACLAVVCFHGSENLGGSTNTLITGFAAYFRHGWFGVPMFFVISGYCLAQGIERRASRHISPLSFWTDRLLRIYPVYWSAFILATTLSLLAIPFNGLPWLSVFPATPLAWLADLSLTTSWTGVPPQLIVSWSLDYEIGFYVLIGFALFVPAATPLGRLSLYTLLTILAHIPGLDHVMPVLGLWPQFACGIAIHTVRQTTLLRFVRVLALLYPLGFAIAVYFDHDSISASAPLFALVLLITLAFENRLPRPPAILVSIGLASYSIYLVHVPFMRPALNLARRVITVDGTAYTVVWLAHLVLGISAGMIFHRLVERHCERLRARFSAA